MNEAVIIWCGSRMLQKKSPTNQIILMEKRSGKDFFGYWKPEPDNFSHTNGSQKRLGRVESLLKKNDARHVLLQKRIFKPLTLKMIPTE